MTTRRIVIAISAFGAGLTIAAALGSNSALSPNSRSNGTKDIFEKALPKMDGSALKLSVVEVNYAPGASTPPHEHSGPTFAYVLEGTVISQIEGESAKT